MPFNQNITPGAPPLLWSNVYDAFEQINENFDILVGGGAGSTVNVVAGLGISTANEGGIITVSNTGVLELANTDAIGSRNPGLGIHVSSAAGTPLITNTGVISISSGSGINVTFNAAIGEAVVNVNPVFDLQGSVFAQGNILLVDGVNAKIVGDVDTARLRTTDPTIALGFAAGQTNPDIHTIAIGTASGQINQGLGAVAVGYTAGRTSQGNHAVALGYVAGVTNQPANSIVINASSIELNGAAAGFYVNPIRSNAAGRIAVYDTTTYEVSYTNIEINGSTLSTNDSSGMIVDVLATFDSDVVVENELIVNNSAVINTLLVNNLNVSGTITSQGSGTPEIFSDNEILLTAGTRVEISSSPLKMASFTTADRDLLAAVNGDVIYNTTLNKFQGYANGTWIDFH